MNKKTFAVSWVLGICFILCGLFLYQWTELEEMWYNVPPTNPPPPIAYHPYHVYAFPLFVVGISLLIVGLVVSTHKKKTEQDNTLKSYL